MLVQLKGPRDDMPIWVNASHVNSIETLKVGPMAVTRINLTGGTVHEVTMESRQVVAVVGAQMKG